MSYHMHAILHSSLFARVLYCTLGMTFRSLLKTKALGCQTIFSMPLFVLLIKNAHIRAVVTRLACRVIARVAVHSPFPGFPVEGHILPSHEVTNIYSHFLKSTPYPNTSDSLVKGNLIKPRGFSEKAADLSFLYRVLKCI